MNSLTRTLSYSALMVLFAGYGVLGYWAPYVFLGVAVLGLVSAVIDKSLSNMRLEVIDWGFLLSFGLLGISIALSAQNGRDVLSWGNFAWFPLFVLLRRFSGPRRQVSEGRFWSRASRRSAPASQH